MTTKTISGSRTHHSNERGAAAVEFAIVISLLVLITGGIIEFGRVLWYYDALTKATRDGARFMSTVSKMEVGDHVSTAQELVQNGAAAAGLSPALASGNINVRCDYGAGWVACTNAADKSAPGPNYVTVATDYNVAFGSWFPISLPLLGPLALAPHTTMRYMCAADAITSC